VVEAVAAAAGRRQTQAGMWAPAMQIAARDGHEVPLDLTARGYSLQLARVARARYVSQDSTKMLSAMISFRRLQDAACRL
jgi:hypothetical protein